MSGVSKSFCRQNFYFEKFNFWSTCCSWCQRYTLPKTKVFFIIVLPYCRFRPRPPVLWHVKISFFISSQEHYYFQIQPFLFAKKKNNNNHEHMAVQPSMLSKSKFLYSSSRKVFFTKTATTFGSPHFKSISNTGFDIKSVLKNRDRMFLHFSWIYIFSCTVTSEINGM